ncbi:TetR/AcrR family transcriptional regulator [Rhodococcus triatomae]
MRRSRSRIENQVRAILDAAHRLIEVKGDTFKTQELAKEAGVALQTFYRYFSSKDELLLAVIGDGMNDACRQWARVAAELPDPVQRLHFYVTSALGGLNAPPRHGALAQFVVSVHWQLHRVFPKELAAAEKPFVDLIEKEIRAATAEGTLASSDPVADAWLVAELVRSVYHHYAYVPAEDDAREKVWQFCFRAIGGSVA